MRIVQLARRHGKAHLHVHRLADDAPVHDVLHPLEVGQIAAVVGHKAGLTCLLAHAVDADAVVVGSGQRFFHINGFASPHGHDGEDGMRRGGSGHVDGIHLRVVDEPLRIGVPPLHVMSLGV